MTDHDDTLAVGTVTTWAGTTRVAASPAGVRHVHLPNWRGAQPPAGSAAPRIAIQRTEDPAAEAHLRQALGELAEYFSGERRVFAVALDAHGPAFFRLVWAEVARVPYGETRSYGEIAHAVGAPEAARAVGAANGANPVAPFVPCHRIVGSDGRLTGYGPGVALKQRLLEMEDAIPRDSDDYDAWIARLGARLGDGAQALLLGIRSAGVYCLPECPGARRALRPARLFQSPDEAESAGYRPCARCHPERARPLVAHTVAMW